MSPGSHGVTGFHCIYVTNNYTTVYEKGNTQMEWSELLQTWDICRPVYHQ